MPAEVSLRVALVASFGCSSYRPRRLALGRVGNLAGSKTVIRRSHFLFLILLLCAIGLMMAGVVALSSIEENSKRYEISAPMPQWRDVPTGFLPEQMAWVKPLLKASACIFAFRAIRQHLEPAKVGFHGCGDQINVTFDENYYEVTVSGIATVDGKPRPFKAHLNHYPPSTNDWAFVVTDIQVD